MVVMQCIREWIKQYPGLVGRLDVDFLSEKEDTYSLDTIPCEEIVKRYKDGSSVRQFMFAISSRMFYEQNIAQNLSNLEFFEDLTAWIEQKASVGELPLMDKNRTAQKIVVTSTAYPFVVAEDGTARYQLQARFEYFQRRV